MKYRRNTDPWIRREFETSILASLAVGMGNTFLKISTSTTVAQVLVLLLIIAFLQWRPRGLASLQTR